MKQANLKISAFLMIGLFISHISIASAANVEGFSFSQNIDLDKVTEIINTHPSQLVSKIKSQNMDVLLVKSMDVEGVALNPLLQNLKIADQDLINNADFDNDTVGTYISMENACCSLKKPTILIRDSAGHYDLLHEYLHHLLFVKGRAKNRVGDQFAQAHRVLTFRQNKISVDTFNYTDRRWRADILSAIRDFNDLLFDKIQESQAEEAIIEKLLAKYIKTNSGYFDSQRQKEGLKYAELSINNAIDMYNLVHQVITIGKSSTLSVRDSIRKGHIKEEYENALTPQEARNFITALNKELERIEPVKSEILKLKDFYNKY